MHERSFSMSKTERLVRFVPFDPATKIAEADAIDRDGNEIRIVKGAFEALGAASDPSAGAQRTADAIAARGHRVIALAVGSARRRQPAWC